MKLHLVNLYDGGDHEHVLQLNTVEDFKRVVEIFPQLHETLFKHHNLKQIANEMADYLSGHHMKAWISED